MSGALLRLLFPPRCVFCGKLGVRVACRSCESAAPRRARPLLEGESFGKCAVPYRYEGAAREAILRFKFRGGRGAAAGLAALMAQCAADELGGTFDCITWAPVSDRRERKRGYDQSFLLAREMGKLWKTPPVRMLKKRWDNPPQSGLNEAERRANVLGVYAAVNEKAIRGARVLLVDDVVTTGATLGACARTLREAGAADVTCVCFACATLKKNGR